MTRPKLAEVLQKWGEGKDPSSEDFQEILKAAKAWAVLMENMTKAEAAGYRNGDALGFYHRALSQYNGSGEG